jgi:hypothetical protein
VKRFIRIISVLFLALTPLLMFNKSSAADLAVFYLTPSSGTVAIGDTISIDLREDSGLINVNVAQAHMTYNTSVLQFVSVVSSNEFGVQTSGTGGGNGLVKVENGAIPAVNGDNLVATIVFKAIGGGTSGLNFDMSTSAIKGNDNLQGPYAQQNILTSATNGTYTVPSPPPSPTPSPSPNPNPASSSKKTSPGPSPSTVPSTSPSASTVKDTAPPKISNITVSGIGTTSAIVSWQTSEPATSQVDYGITTNYELTSGNGLLVTTHKLALNYKTLNPDTEFHFRIKSVDSSGNVSTSQDQTFTTKAGNAVLALKVVDQNGKAVKSAKVTIGKVSGTTDKNGHAMLYDLAVGPASAVVDYKGHKTTKSIEIDPPAGPAQSVTIKINSPKNYLPIIILPTLGLLVLAAGAYFLSKSSNQPFLGSGLSDEPIVTGGSVGATTTSGSSATPPAPVQPPAQPTSSNSVNNDKEKNSAPAFDPSKEPPPPTIVRPTIPPRS